MSPSPASIPFDAPNASQNSPSGKARSTMATAVVTAPRGSDSESDYQSAKCNEIELSKRCLLSRRTLCYVLGFVWLFDGALQLQSFMFTTGFAHQVIAPAATGQPVFVSAPVLWNARLISGHPALFDGLFAGVQIALGAGFFVKRAVKLVIAGSVAWAAGVWHLGEGLGGLAGAHVTALVGAPGAAFVYAVLAIAAWPSCSLNVNRARASNEQRPPHWVLWAWGALWVGFAFLNLLPGNIRPSDLTGQLSANADSVPSWLAAVDRTFASLTRSAGLTGVGIVVAIELTIGLLAFSYSRLRVTAVYVGLVLATLYWAAGQSFGQLLSGQATDPNSGPLVIVLGLAAIGAMRRDNLPPLGALRGSGTEVPSRSFALF